MKAGKLVVCGKPETVLTSECLEAAYGVPLNVADPGNGNRVCIPLTAIGEGVV